MDSEHWDIIVIGAGGGGMMAALSAARVKAKVMLVEKKGLMGGLKVNGRSQVLDNQDRVIDGLYAIGEVAGMGQYMGNGLNSGFGQVAPLVLGKLVAEDLAAR